MLAHAAFNLFKITFPWRVWNFLFIAAGFHQQSMCSFKFMAIIISYHFCGPGDAINSSHKPHNAFNKYPIIHLFNRNRHTCTFLFQNVAPWDMGLVHCEICATGLLKWPPKSREFSRHIECCWLTFAINVQYFHLYPSLVRVCAWVWVGIGNYWGNRILIIPIQLDEYV